MDSSKQLGEERILHLIVKFSIPAIVGMLVNAIYNVVDRIFIGNFVGPDAFAGTIIAYPYMMIVIAFGMLIGIGATSLLSIRLGEGKREEAERILGNGFSMLVITAVLLSAVTFIFLEPILKAFGASDVTLPYASEYLRIILFGFGFQLIGFGMNNFIRAEGRPRIAMKTMLIGAVLNIILDAVFMIGFDMGIKGAALATVIAQFVSMVWVLRYFFCEISLLKLKRENTRLQADLVKGILSLGSAQFSIQIANSFITLIFNRSFGHYGGDIAISAFGVVNSLSVMILMPIFGINQGAQPIIGYNFGAKKYDRVKKALKLAIIGATMISVVGFILAQTVPEFLASFFSDSDQLTASAAHGISTFFLVFPLVGFQIVSSNYFQATGKPKKAFFLSMSRQVIILVPAILILPIFFGVDGIWYAMPVSDFIASFLTGILLFRDMRAMK